MDFNRYQDISTSTYNPRQLSETLMVPMAKRAMHEQAQKDLYSQVGELDKIDPLQQHFEEAQQIKANLLKKIDEQSANLATKGFNFDTNADIFKTNRYIKDQFSPTGRAGQINAAKQAYFKEREDFLKNAETQKIGRVQALKRWTEKTKDYTGYNEARDITNVTPQGLAAHQDYEDDLSKYHSILGKTETEAKSGGFHLQDSGVGDGSMIMVNSKGEKVTSSNLDQVNNAARGFAAKWLHPQGEGYQYAQDAGLNITPEKVANDFKAMYESKIGSGTESSGSFIKADDAGKKEKVSTLEPVNVEAVNFNNESDLASKLKGTYAGEGKPYDIVASRAGVKQDYGVEKTKNQMISEATKTPEYRRLANNIARTESAFAKMKYDDPKLVARVSKYLDENKDYTRQNKYNDPNVSKEAMLFASQNISKDKKAASQQLLDQVYSGGSEMRTIDGEPIDMDKVRGFTYVGDMSPKSHVTAFGNNDQNILTHRGYVKMDDNTIKKVYVSRNPDDFKTPQHQAAKFLNNIGHIADRFPGVYHHIKSDVFDKHDMTDVNIKYNKGKDTYNVSFKGPDGQHHSKEYTQEDFNNVAIESYK